MKKIRTSKSMLLSVWLIMSLILIVVSFIEVDDQFFVIALPLILGSLFWINVSYSSYQYKYTVNFAILVLVSMVSCWSLYSNYFVALTDNSSEGIGISNSLAYLYIGEDGWSVQLFEKVFHIAAVVSVVIMMALIIT
jgi:hypothetical protein